MDHNVTSRSWRNIIIILAVLVLLTGGAGASPFSEFLHIAGLGVETQSTGFNGIVGYTYNQAGEAIVRVSHTITPGTGIIETYYFGSKTINSRFDCSWAWLMDSCNLHLDSGNQSMNYTFTDVSLLPLDKTVIFTLLSDLNGTAGAGLGVKQISTSYIKSSIFIPELGNTSIYQLSGNSNKPIDLTVETLTYDQFNEYQTQVNDIASGNFVERLLSYYYTFSSIIGTLFYFFKLFFYDHPILTFAAIETYALMYAMEAKDMQKWIERFADVHFKAFEFALRIINFIVTIVTNVINALKPV